ncbi:MAG: chromosomal replication initiator protein DnaA, partial [Paracoccaceae bacterium]|nr:chromosomal replication initiator protein DnaA [Paracoccaceae bacterium]
MTDETWGNVREELLKTIGKNNFATWIEPLKFDGINDGVARFLVPTSFFGTWVSRNFADR